MESLVAILAARLRNIPVLLREEATLLNRRSHIRRAIKRATLAPLLGQIYGLCIGSNNQQFYRHYGISEQRLFWAPYTVDNESFQLEAADLSARKSILKTSFGIDPRVPVVLFCARFVPQKDPFTLLRAFAMVRRETLCSLLFVGDGPLRSALELMVSSDGIPDVHFAGFLNRSEISQAYAVADIFVLPSATEPWGLVVNEAMNFSLPIIVSDRVGSAADLVTPGVNGYVFPVGNVSVLARQLHNLVENSVARSALGAASKTIIDGWNIDSTTTGIVQAVKTVTHNSMQGDRKRRRMSAKWSI